MTLRGDFTADRRLIAVSTLAIAIGASCAVVAAALLRLIAWFTQLFWFQRLSFASVAPAGHAPGAWSVLPPVIGGLVIGLMARYGSDRIRGHGIPEALEAILIGRARMEPKLAVLKPLSSAISIGSGGPFGAEGPIIMTGGAVGSIAAQVFHFTTAERKTLLVAGAAGGMSATFAAPVAAVLLAVELLLFEWKPRSFIPVALASSVAAMIRPFLLGHGPLFVVPPVARFGVDALAACVLVGIVGGALASTLTWCVYASEHLFPRLPLHWMWWPAIGGLIVGLGGLVEPRALGVGNDVIAQILAGGLGGWPLARLLAVKGVIWSLALGSGTSGGVLAPLMMMGSAAGQALAPWLPATGQAWWPMIGLAAILAGTMRAPLTAIVFAVELTGRSDALLPLLVAAAVAYAFTVLVMPRSILTEKVARRGHHLSREYGVDPLETLLVGQVMTQPVETVPARLPMPELEAQYFDSRLRRRHQGYPVVDESGRLVGVITRSELMDLPSDDELQRLVVATLLSREPVVAFADETCRAAAERMAREGVGRLPVVTRDQPLRPVGVLTRSDLLKARERQLDTEQRRERLIELPGGDWWEPFRKR